MRSTSAHRRTDELEASTAARDALGICEEMMLALDVQVARGLRARKRGEALRGRALELLEKARSLTTGLIRA